MKMVNSLEKIKQEDLIVILKELLLTIQQCKKNSKDFLLVQNENEAQEWLAFLQGHTDIEELKSLENEIADRFFSKFDFAIDGSEFDIRRTQLMKDYMIKSNNFLKQ